MARRFATWLDWYADGARKKIAAIPNQPFGPVANDSEALWVMAASILSTSGDELRKARAGWQDRGPDSSEEDLMTRIGFWQCISALASRPKAVMDAGVEAGGLFGGEGLKLPRRLVETLSKAARPTGTAATEAWQAMAQQHVWYFDIPHHAIRLGDLQVRAVFTQPSGAGTVSATALLTMPGSNSKAGIFSWLLVGEHPDPAVVGLAVDESLDRELVRQQVTDFVALALLYHRSIDRPERLQSARQPRAKSRKRRLGEGAPSLFAVYRLPEPVDNLGRPRGPRGASDDRSWTLGHRSTVRGHFRWQACGTGRKQRELRWIAEHVRGAELPAKPRLTQLPLPKSPSDH